MNKNLGGFKNMKNSEVYKKTLVFSLRRFIFNTICVLVLCALGAIGFLVMDKLNDKGLIGLAIGVVFALVLIGIVSHFFSYTFKAGQIAMMTKAYTEGSLPDDVYGEGKRMVKERFTTVALYYAATSLIKGIFQQIGNGIAKLGNAVGGDTGNAIGSTISFGIQVVVGFLCDCCLGWIFYRKDQNAVKATLDGAVIFFKNGKALLKNLGRIFGIGLASFVLIGGAFTGVNYLILGNFPELFERIMQELPANTPAWFMNTANLTLVGAAIIGIIFWSIIHSVFIRPFVLTGVLRNFLEAGMKNAPSEASYSELEKISPKFAKAHKEV